MHTTLTRFPRPLCVSLCLRLHPKMCILHCDVHIVLFTRHFLLFTHHIVFFTHHIVCARTRTHARALVSYYHGLGCARDPAAAAAMYRSAADSKNVEAMVCDA